MKTQLTPCTVEKDTLFGSKILAPKQDGSWPVLFQGDKETADRIAAAINEHAALVAVAEAAANLTLPSVEKLAQPQVQHFQCEVQKALNTLAAIRTGSEVAK